MTYFCYFNLHKKVFSVRNEKTKRVEYHSNIVLLENCTFKVSKAGREKVRREKKKNVHAGVKGELRSINNIHFNENDFVEITYNPYLYDTFVVKSDKIPVKSAKLVILKDKRIFAQRVLV